MAFLEYDGIAYASFHSSANTAQDITQRDLFTKRVALSMYRFAVTKLQYLFQGDTGLHKSLKTNKHTGLHK